jgi:hypothetical protein
MNYCGSLKKIGCHIQPKTSDVYIKDKKKYLNDIETQLNAKYIVSYQNKNI